MVHLFRFGLPASSSSRGAARRDEGAPTTARVLPWPAPAASPRHVRTFWTVVDATGQWMSCQLWAVAAGLEVRTLSGHEPCRLLQCCGPHAEVEAAMHAEDWRQTVLDAGFLDAPLQADAAHE